MLMIDFNKAVIELQHKLYFIKQELHDNGWTYDVVDDAPNTFEDLLQQYRNHGKHMLVYGGGSDKTIFEHPKYNHVLRFWHDVVHITNGLSFSLEDERRVSDLMVRKVLAMGASNDCARVLHADIAGQIEYYNTRKQFVGNQKAFCHTCLNRGVKYAVMGKH